MPKQIENKCSEFANLTLRLQLLHTMPEFHTLSLKYLLQHVVKALRVENFMISLQ
jgi:hypothetical protein